MTWEMSELTYEVTGEHRGWMLINTETKRTITCESEAEARAIADAPLLLEEVKRLREENTYLNHMLDGVDKHTLDYLAEEAQIKMHEAGECYDFCIVCETDGEEE